MIVFLNSVLIYFVTVVSRSPPVSLPGTGPVFPTNHNLGTVRGAHHMFNSQETLSSGGRQAPNPPIGKSRSMAAEN